MSRHTICLSDEEDQFVGFMREAFGSISGVIHASLKSFQKEQLKKYYQQKSEYCPELQKAQSKIINKLSGS